MIIFAEKSVKRKIAENIVHPVSYTHLDVILIVADKIKNHVLTVLGALRQKVAKKLDISPEGKYNFLWITEFPFFEYDEELKQFVAMPQVLLGIAFSKT